ncbi:hypothetical protein UFOVP713_29 [uncultured Caudovirales phage]|uniref:Uncharacterized protein n=1 Tax=uncultured Caudovirales phage TaxID=2100421 RepID=A0A6J5NNW6_9CAUD|nr:hypothetical protein UFOVP713_29 [uncultured Caudovirales phage]
MAKGIIQDKMARPEGDDIDTETIKKNINMPPELQEAYERVVIAGMKVMFSKESHKLMLDELQKEGPIGQKLGMGIAGLMLMLFKESNETMPPQVIVPAGVNLLSRAADFIRESKIEKITNADIGDAMEIMISTILQKFGVGPEQMEQMLNQYSNENIPAEMGA